MLGFVAPVAMFVWLALGVVGGAAGPGGDAWTVLADHTPNTLALAALASGVAVVLGVLVVYGRRLRGGPVTAAATRTAGLGYALPGTVVAVGLLGPLTWADHRLNDAAEDLIGVKPGLVLTGGVVALILGYQTRFLGVALGMLAGGLERVRPSLDAASRVLGSSGWRLLLRVHLPLMRASLAAAALLVFVDVVKELPVTLMLRPFDFDTLAVRVYQLAAEERLEEASLAALALVLVGTVPVAVLSLLLDAPAPRTRRRRRARGSTRTDIQRAGRHATDTDEHAEPPTSAFLEPNP